MITQRGWAAVAASAAGIGLAVLVSSFLLAFATVAVFTFVVSDILVFTLAFPRSRAGRFRIERHGPARRVSVGCVTLVRVIATYHGARGFWGELVDMIPDGCAVLAGRSGTTRWWTPGESVVLEYSLRVLERGRHFAGPTIVLAAGPLGLSFVRLEVGRAESFLALPPEPIIPRGASTRALYSRIQGRLSLRKRGFGSEMRSLRPYEVSDDIRNVAWRRSTPENVLVREYDQEGRQDYLVVFDLSASMAGGPSGETALDIAASAGRLVAGLVERSQEDRIGVLSMAGRTVDFLELGRGQRHLAEVDERLAMLSIRPGEFELSKLFEELRRRVRLRTHIFVFTALSAPPRNATGPHRKWIDSRHHLCFFTPDIVRIFSGYGADLEDPAIVWARRYETEQAQARHRRLRSEGVPLFPFDARNVSSRVLAAYVQARGWGVVR